MSPRTPPAPPRRASPRPASKDPFRRNATGTFFWDDEYAHFHWNGMSRGSSRKLSELDIPLDRIDAACVDPRDWNRVWFFCENKVVDYRAAEGVSVASTPLDQHPIFKSLPTSYHAGIYAAIIDDTYVEGRAGPDEWGACQNVYVFGKDSFVTVALPVVEGQALRVSEPKSPSWAKDYSYVLNGAGLRAGLVYLVASAGYDVGRWGSAPMFLPLDGYAEEPFALQPWCSLTRDGVKSPVPHAAIPVKLTPRLGGSKATPNGTSTLGSATVKEDDRPATIQGIFGSRPAGLVGAKVYLATLPAGQHKGPTHEPRRMRELYLRERALVRRLTWEGDIPDYLREFVRVTAERDVSAVQSAAGAAPTKKRCRMVYYVARDFLMIGDAIDCVRVPLSGVAAQRVADFYSCMLPTGRMAQQILDATAPCQTMFYVGRGDKDGGMTATDSFVNHDREIEGRKLGCFVAGRLAAGHKKDVTLDSQMYTLIPAARGGPPVNLPIMFWGGCDSLGNLTHGNAEGKSDPAHDHGHQEYAEGIRLVSVNAWLQIDGGDWTECHLPSVLMSPSDKNYPEALKKLGLNLHELIAFVPIESREPDTTPKYRVVEWMRKAIVGVLNYRKGMIPDKEKEQKSKLEISKEQRKKIDECNDAITLERWLDQAETAETTEEALR